MPLNSIRRAGAFTGFEGLHAVLQGLPAEMQSTIIAAGVGAGAKPLVKAAKSLAPKETGALRASITSVVRKNRRAGTAVAVVGPDRAYYRKGKRLKRSADMRGADRPANYAHLVEFGHVAVARRRGTSRRKGTATEIGVVAPKPFIRPAVQQQAAPVGEAVQREILTRVDKTIVRLRNKL